MGALWINVEWGKFRPPKGAVVEVKYGTNVRLAKYLGRRRFFKSFRPEWKLTTPVTDFRVEYWRYI